MQYMTRKDWGAKAPKSSFSKLAEVKGLVVHWSAYPTALSKTEELSQLRQIQDLHQNDRGWNDIAYNFCVGDSGTIYEARGYEHRSAAQGGNTRDEINYNNKHYVAVCWLGGSNPDDQPSKEAVAAVITFEAHEAVPWILAVGPAALADITPPESKLPLIVADA